MRSHRLLFATVVIAIAAVLTACGGGTSKATPTPGATSTPKPAASATSEAIPLPLTNTPVPATATPAPVVNPCTFPSLEGQPLSVGPGFALNVEVKWQLCLGGVAAGNGEKYLFRTTDGGADWKLISQTTLGNPTPQPGVGELPNGNGVVQILFLDDTHGWMGMNSPGENLWRSQDGGVTWAAITAIPPAIPVESITFTDSMHGTVVTPDGTWTTSDGGVTWVKQ